jgi:hypothetical protein
MVTYEVTTTVDPRLVGAALTRSATGRYRVRYEAPTEADLERYLATHATRLRDDFASHFPEGVTASREVWIALQSWGDPAGAAG